MRVRATAARTLGPGVLLAALACAPALAPGTPFVRDLEVRTVSDPPPIDDDPVEEQLALEESSCFGGKKAFDDSHVEVDAQRVANYYAARGFFEATVRSEVVADEEARDVRWLVTPGPMTRVVEVRLLGEEAVDRETLALIHIPAQRLRAMGRYDAERYERAKTRIEARLLERGYPYARVAGRVFVDKGRGEAIIEIVLNPGPLVYFGALSIVGNGEIPARAIEREVLWEEGERYEPTLLSKTEAGLYRLGVFASVHIKLLEPSSEAEATRATATVPVTIEVSVSKLQDLSVGGGIGLESRRQEARLRAEWRSRNVFGGLRALEVSLRPGYAVSPVVWMPERHGPLAEAHIAFAQPDMRQSGIDLLVSTSYQLAFQEAYQFHGPGLRVGVERPLWGSRIKPGIAWNLVYYNFFNVQRSLFDNALTPVGLGGIGVSGRAYRLAFVEEYVSLDLRDNVIDPSDGLFAEVRAEQGAMFLGGEFDYLKVTPEVRGYVGLGRRVVIAARLLLGGLWPLGGSDSPITRRYRLGGASNHRGFSAGRLSPQVPSQPEPGDAEASGEPAPPQDPVPIGGNAELLASLDLRVRMFKVFGYWLSGTAFVDAGDAPPAVTHLNLRLLHVAVGPSLSLETPVGSIRAALGVRLNRLGTTTAGVANPDPRRRFAFQLSIGAAF